MIWIHSVDDLHAFNSYLNSIHPTIKFTFNYSFASIPFLYVNVFLSITLTAISRLTFTLKATDKHQYLLHSSCHPQHTKRAIPLIQLSFTSSYLFGCSSDETSLKQRSHNELKSYLNKFKRRYNLSFINQ